jgi:hypothetical protein
MNKTMCRSNRFGAIIVGGLVAVASSLATKPVPADTLDAVEKFFLHGAIPIETDDGAGNSGANPSVTLPVKGTHVGSSSTITFKVVNGTVLNNNQTNAAGGLCATKYGSGTVNVPDTKNSSITMTLTGIGCSDGITGLDDLTWIVTGGTGRFAGAVGTGHLSYSWGPASGAAPAASILDMEGTIQRQ